ncbi:MAG: SDR family NAD(P)-dependent oxidoreductase, partial [Hyphomonadaceae bacterium]|nr:SDR family NAD(P)-dependent oxidoreductase [Hyphomonadaceae bacterium]
MLLQGKNALIFAASGAIASGVAERFAREGATVWLSARNAAKLEPLALRIRDAGGVAHMATLDATDDEGNTSELSPFIDNRGSLLVTN